MFHITCGLCKFLRSDGLVFGAILHNCEPIHSDFLILSYPPRSYPININVT